MYGRPKRIRSSVHSCFACLLIVNKLKNCARALSLEFRIFIFKPVQRSKGLYQLSVLNEEAGMPEPL